MVVSGKYKEEVWIFEYIMYFCSQQEKRDKGKYNHSPTFSQLQKSVQQNKPIVCCIQCSSVLRSYLLFKFIQCLK